MAFRCKDVTDEDVTALKDAVENLNTRKSTINWVTGFLRTCVVKMPLIKRYALNSFNSWSSQ